MVFKLKFEIQYSILLLGLVFGSVILNSCKESTGTSNGELIDKINAVDEQMMVQGNINDEERQAILGLASLVSNEEDFTNQKDLKGVVHLDTVEFSPVYPGCEGLNKDETRQCFIDSIDTYVKKTFNPDVIEVTEPHSIEVIFKIDEQGEIVNLKARDANVVVQAEALRVIKSLPNMKPATQNGKAVAVMYSVFISYGG